MSSGCQPLKKKKHEVVLVGGALFGSFLVWWLSKGAKFIRQIKHYTNDKDAIIGPNSLVKNFVFANDFSGLGLQQSPAVSRGITEWISLGEYRSIDLKPLRNEIIEGNKSPLEKAVI